MNRTHPTRADLALLIPRRPRLVVARLLRRVIARLRWRVVTRRWRWRHRGHRLGVSLRGGHLRVEHLLFPYEPLTPHFLCKVGGEGRGGEGSLECVLGARWGMRGDGMARWLVTF